jgi:hypothetical protein
METLDPYHITPPSVLISCPVIFAESAEARKRARVAASSGPELFS